MNNLLSSFSYSMYLVFDNTFDLKHCDVTSQSTIHIAIWLLSLSKEDSEENN